ncbi:MAG TPA: cytochrome P450 [Burkholderiales bacterium]|jgi:cytochrome P450|nr:cytochrome P450 [Burkholderiales bacterium]
MRAQSSSARPPGPPAAPLIGHSLQFSRDPLRLLTRAARDCGDVALLSLGGNDVYFLSHPDLVREVLAVQRTKFDLSAIRHRLELVLGLGLITSRGDLHTQQRRLMQPVFRKSRVDLHAPVMIGYAERQSERWSSGSEIDVNAEMTALSQRIAAKTLFDHEVGDESDVMVRDLGTIMEFYSARISPFMYLSLKLPLPSTFRFRRAVRRFDAAIYQMIEQRRANPANRADLLSLLLQAKDDETNRRMDARQVRDEMITLFGAGHETVANALAWTLYLLARTPSAQAALLAETQAVLGGRPRFDAADAGRLRYARQVLLEGLRLYPPVWFIGRRAMEDVQLGPHRVPKGTNVLLSQYVVQRDPRWFEDPHAFRPERWTEAFMKGLHLGAYFPFSAGERHCIGEGFAWLETTLVLATLAAHWRFDAPPGSSDVGTTPSITLRPDRPIRVRVERR